MKVNYFMWIKHFNTTKYSVEEGASSLHIYNIMNSMLGFLPYTVL